MTHIATTIEQSKKLIELGLDKYTCDMYYYKEFGDNYILQIPFGEHFNNKQFFEESPDDVPAWSLSKLLELMPFPLLTQHKNNKWYMVTYPNGKHISLDEENNPIDAAFEMMCYLLENKLI